MRLPLPDFALVVLVGSAGSGKAALAARCFEPGEILALETFLRLAPGAAAPPASVDAGDEPVAVQAATEALAFVAGKRLERRRLTVINAANVRREARRGWVALARRYHCPAVALVLDVPEANAQAASPETDPAVIHLQIQALRQGLEALPREGFYAAHVLASPAEIRLLTIERQPLPSDLRADYGPFDIIGDVHGCLAELDEMLDRLGYRVAPERASHPARRRAIFAGDLADRGPDPVGVLRLVMGMAAAGQSLVVPGNHDDKLRRALSGRAVSLNHGLAETLAQITAQPAEFAEQTRAFLAGLPSHYVLAGGRLVVAHAGLPESMHNRLSRQVRDFALYGLTTGEVDQYGLPVRLPWARDYQGQALVVYGHTPVAAPERLNHTLNIDTGCVFGGALSAYRFPEDELTSVRARWTYAASKRPFLPPAAAAPARPDPGA
ncbi:MAG: AAA family ATPase [Anaerolineales bacterium]|nr:AAA family ATPase [Anaerolineales bacterium]